MSRTRRIAVSSELFQKIFKHNHDGMVVLDARGVILASNNAAAKLFGSTPEKLIGIVFVSLIPSAERDLWKHPLRHKETRYAQMGEGVLMVDPQSFVVDGVSMMTLTFHVLSYKKEIERNLFLAKTSHRTLIELIEDDLFVLNPAGIVLYVNEHGSKTIRRPREGVIGKNIVQIFPKDAKHIKESIQMVLKTKKAYVRESKFVFPGGVVLWIHTELVPIMEQGDVVAILGVAHDISENKRAEETIRQLEEKYEALVENSSDGILVIQDGDIRFVNAQMARIFMQTTKECVGKPFLDFVIPANRTAVRQHMTEAMQKKVCDVRCEFQVQIKNNTTRYIEAHGSIVPFQGKPAIMLIARDKTQEHDIEKMKSDFISITSHQMRTPLTGIKWFTELLAGQRVGPLNEEQLNYLEQIAVSNNRMIQLINDILNVSKIEQGNGYVLQMKLEDPHVLLRLIVKESQHLAKAKKQKIQFEKCSHAPVHLRFDREKMREVFQNIISNALKYSPEHAEIVMHCGPVKGEYVISIQDRGVGIPEKQQNNVFQRFFRADNVIGTQSGTGLGLYVAKSIVDLHKGRIWFESKERKGTTFFVALPIVHAKTKRKKPSD